MNFTFGYVEIQKFTADSKQLAVYDYSWTGWPEYDINRLIFFDVTDGSITDSLQFGNFHIKDIAFSYDGNMMVVCDDTNKLVIYRTKTWEMIDSINIGQGIFQLKFTRDNKNIVLNCDHFKIYSLDSGKVINHFLKHLLIMM